MFVQLFQNDNAFGALVLLLTFLVSYWLINFYLPLRALRKKVAKIPGPEPLPIVGNAHIFLGKNMNIFGKIMELCDQYPDLGKGWMGNRLIFFVSKPEYLEIILKSPHAINKADNYKFSHFVTKKGLVMSEGGKWRKDRRTFQPSFNKKILDQYFDDIDRQSAILAGIIRDKCRNGGQIDAERHLINFSLDTFMTTVIGLNETNAQTTDSDFSEMSKLVDEVAFTRMCSPPFHIDPIYRLSTLYQKQLKAVEGIKLLADKMIQGKLVQISAGKPKYQGKIPFPDDLIRNNEDRLPVAEDHIRSFIFAGVESSALTLQFALLFLALNPEIQTKVHREVVEVLGEEPNRRIALSDLPNLKYTECVIKETLRMVTIFPVIGRHTTADIDLGDGTVIPNDSQIYIVLQKTHMRPDQWVEPDKFIPERFEKEFDQDLDDPDAQRKINKRHPYAYVPFSAGPRNCIGLRSSMMVIKVCLANLIREFSVHTKYKRFEDVELITHVAMKCKEKLMLRFDQRPNIKIEN